MEEDGFKLVKSKRSKRVVAVVKKEPSTAPEVLNLEEIEDYVR